MRWLVLILASAASAGYSQQLPAGVLKKATVGGITEYAFPNGLRVVLYPDPANPKVTVNITYLVGSRHEGYGESGMAHLLEHLLFIETTNGREIKKEITSRGAQWNGTTWYDRTNYYETVPAGDENLRWALGLEADRMVNAKMEKRILDTEMTVVRNEFERGENNPGRVLEERVLSTAYLWHNYGKSTIGSRQDIERVPIERLATFYRKYYRPDNAVLAVSGQIDEAKTLAMVNETLARIPKPSAKLEEPYTVEPVQDGERFVELRRVGNNQELMIAYHGPAAAHPDAAALSVLSGVLGGGGRFAGSGQGRLSKALVDNKKAISASMAFQALHDPGYIMVSAGLNKEQSLDEARRIIYETIESVVKEPPGQDELDRSKNRRLRMMENRMLDAQQVGLGLTTPISQGDWRLWFLELEQTKKVTVDDLVRVAKAYFKPSNRTVGVFIPSEMPDRTVVPETPDLESLLKDLKSEKLVSQGEAFEPTPANIEGRLIRAKLSNGLRMVVLPRKTAGDNIMAALDLRFGDEISLSGKNAAAQMVASLLMRGTRSKTRQQLQDAIDKLNARISVGGGAGGGRGPAGGFASISSIGASVEAKKENFYSALRLAVEILREPAFPESEFDQIRRQRLAALDSMRTEPGALASIVLARRMSPFADGHPLYSRTLEEQAEEWRKLTLGDVKKYYSEFYGASTGELAVLGPVDTAELSKIAGDLFGAWNSLTKFTRIVAPYKPVDGFNEKLETPDKENAQFEVAMRLRVNDESPEYPALLLANYMFGGTISSRMPNRIRNMEGLSYGASSRIGIPSYGESASFAATISSNPANTPKVEASFTDEIRKSLKEGFTQAELDAAKKAYLDLLKVSRSQDGSLLRLIATREERGRTMKWDEDMEAKLKAVTRDQVNAAWRKHIDPAKLVIVKAGDFRKAGVLQ